MKLKCIEDITYEQLSYIVPPELYFWVEVLSNSIDNIFAFALTDDSNTIGIAVYQKYRGQKTWACCIYVMTVEKYRRQGYATKLLLDAMEDLKARGYTRILAAHQGEPDLIVSGLLQKCGMILCDKEIDLGYSVGTLKELGIASKLDKVGVFKNVKKIDELQDFAINKIMKKRFGNGSKLDLGEFDPKYCRFFVIDNEVQGFIFADTKDDEYFYVLDLWVVPSEKTTMAFPLMMFSLMNEICEVADEKAGMIISFIDNKQVDAMKKYFGEPEENIEFYYYQYK